MLKVNRTSGVTSTANRQGRKAPKNKGGFGGGLGYITASALAGIGSIAEGAIDIVGALGADLTGNHEAAENMFKNNVVGDWYSDVKKEYNPGGAMSFVGDVTHGIGQSSVLFIPYAGVPLFYAGIGAQGVSGAAAKTGEVGIKEVAYGATSAAIEGAVDAALGGTATAIGNAVKGVGKGASKAGKNVFKAASDATRKGLGKTILSSAAGEFGEEFISEYADTILQRAYKIDPNASTSLKDAIYAGAVGAVSGAVSTSVATVPKSIKYLSKGESIIKRGNSQTLVNTATKVADRLAAKGTSFKDAAEWVTALRGQVDAYNDLVKKGKSESASAKTILGEMQAYLYFAETKAAHAGITDRIMNASEEDRAALAEYINMTVKESDRPKTYTAEDVKNNTDEIASQLAIMEFAGVALNYDAIKTDEEYEREIEAAIAEERGARDGQSGTPVPTEAEAEFSPEFAAAAARAETVDQTVNQTADEAVAEAPQRKMLKVDRKGGVPIAGETVFVENAETAPRGKTEYVENIYEDGSQPLPNLGVPTANPNTYPSVEELDRMGREVRYRLTPDGREVLPDSGAPEPAAYTYPSVPKQVIGEISDADKAAARARTEAAARFEAENAEQNFGETAGASPRPTSETKNEAKKKSSEREEKTSESANKSAESANKAAESAKDMPKVSKPKEILNEAQRAERARKRAERIIEWNKANKPDVKELNRARSLVKGFDNLSPDRRQSIIRMIRSAQGVDEKIVKGVANLMAIKAGADLEVRFDDQVSEYGMSATIGDKTLILVSSMADYKDTVKGTVAHELVHYLEKKPGYKTFADYVLKTVKPEAKAKVEKDITKRYNKHYRAEYEAEYAKRGLKGAELESAVNAALKSEEHKALIESEVVAELVGKALNNEKFLARYARRGNTDGFIKKAWSFLRSMVKELKSKGEENNELADIIMPTIKSMDRLLKMENASEGAKGKKYLFAGDKAKTADKMKLATAKEMLESGADIETVRRETGWFKGYDGKWRFEIDDFESGLIENPKLEWHEDDGEVYFTGKISDIFDHKELFAAYPDLKDINVVIQKTELGVDAIYQPKSNYITLSIEQFKRHTKAYHDYLDGGRRAEIKRIEASEAYKEYNKLYDDAVMDEMKPTEWLEAEKAAREKFYSSELGKRYYQLMWGKDGFVGDKFEFGWSKAAKETLVHELQHAVQKREGFASGTNTRDANYDRNAGEIEARDAAHRANMTSEQRKNTRPNIDREDVVFAEDGVSYYSAGTKEDAKKESKITLQILNDNLHMVPPDNVFDLNSDGIVTDPKKSDFVNNIFIMQGGFAKNTVLGRVELTAKGAKSTVFHGYGKNKLIASNAIKATIENGVIISTTINYENKGIDRYVIAAKGIINGSDAYIAVVIEGYPLNGGHKQFYLHEVLTKETAPHIMTATQMYADTVSGTVSDNSIPQKSDLSTPSAKKYSLAPKKSQANGKKYALAKSSTETFDTLMDERFAIQNKIPELVKAKKDLESSKEYNKFIEGILSNDETGRERLLAEYKTWEKQSKYAEIVTEIETLQKRYEEIRQEIDEIHSKKSAETERKAIEKSGLSDADYFRKAAIKEFGYTPFFVDAGYLLPNGKLLNFSGEKGKHFGSRGNDHRAIGIVYENLSGGKAMLKFMSEGNIRVMAETPGLDISSTSEPTSEQYSTIKKFVREYAKEKYFAIDITNENGNVVGTYEYENNINADRVVNDIKYYFQNGAVREKSSISQFLTKYSLAPKKAETNAKKAGKKVEAAKAEDDKVTELENKMRKMRERMARERAEYAKVEGAQVFSKSDVKLAVDSIEGWTQEEVLSLAKGQELQGMSRAKREEMISQIYIALHEEGAKGRVGTGYVAVKGLAMKIADEYLDSAQIKGEDGKSIHLSDIYDAETIERFKKSLTDLLFGEFAHMGQTTQNAEFQAIIRAQKESFFMDQVSDKLEAKEARNLSYQGKKLRDLVEHQKRDGAAEDIALVTKVLASVVDAKGNIRVNAVDKAMGEAARFFEGEKLKIESEKNALKTEDGKETQALSDFAWTVNDELKYMIDEYMRLRKGREGKGLTAEEMKLASDVLRAMKVTIERYNKEYIDGHWVDVEAAAKDCVADLTADWRKTEYKNKVTAALGKAVGGIKENYFYKILTPETVVETIEGFAKNGVLKRLYHSIRVHKQKAEHLAVQMKKPLAEFIDSKEHRYTDDKGISHSFRTKLNKKMISVDGANGVADLTLGEAIYLYMLTKREPAHAGLLEEGYIVFNEKNQKRARLKLTDIEITQNNIYNQLDATDIEFLKMAESFFNETASKIKHDADMNIFGYTNIQDGYYVPMIRDRYGRMNGVTDARQSIGSIVTVYNKSFNQNLVENAKALEGKNIMSIINDHADGLADYAELYLPLKAFDRTYNRAVMTNDGLRSIREVLNNDIWSGTEKYFKDLFADIQGQREKRDDPLNNVVGKIRSAWVNSVLGANVKVIATQTTSLVAATQVIGTKYIAKCSYLASPGKLPGLDEIRERAYKYSDIIEARNFDMGALKAQGNIDKVNKIGELSGRGIGWMDERICLAIFHAAELQVQDQKGYAVGSEENARLAASLADEAIYTTQSMSSASERSAWQRSDSEIMKMLTMFTSDTVKNLSHFFGNINKWNAYRMRNNASDGAYEAELKQAGKDVRRSIRTLAATGIMLGLIAQAFKYIYGKEEEEPEDKQKDFYKDIAGSTLNILPGVSDVVDKLVFNYDMSINVIDVANDTIESVGAAFKTAGKLMSGEYVSRNEIIKNGVGVVRSGLTLFGIPVSPVEKLFAGTIRFVSPEVAYGYNNIFGNPSYTADLKKAVESGDAELAEYVLEKLYESEMSGVYTSAELEEIVRLYSLTDEKGKHYNVLPQRVPEKLDDDTKMSAAQRKQFNKIYSQSSAKVNELIRSDYYAALDDKAKAKAISNVYGLYFDSAKAQVMGKDWSANVAYSHLTGNVTALMASKAYKSGLEEYKNERGKTVTVKEQFAEYLKGLELSKEDQLIIAYANGYKGKATTKSVLKYINSLGLPAEVLEQIAKALNLEVKDGVVVEKED